MLEYNKLYHGNCFDFFPKLEDGTVHLILSDFPYEQTSRNNWDKKINLIDFWKEAWRVLKSDGSIVLTAQQPFTSELIESQYLNFKYEWIWRKQQGTGFLNAKKQPLRNHESILVFYKKQPTYNPQFTIGKPYSCKSGRASSNYREQTSVVTENEGKRYPLTVLEFPYDRNKIHPTQKPVALFEYMIKTYTNENELVMDCCAGSNTTGLAAQNTGRRWI